MVFRDVLDIANVLIMEAYRELGMKFEEAYEDLANQVRDPVEQAKPPSVAKEAAAMAVLQSMMGTSDFKGPKG
jgi:hypothetical protein